MADFSREGVVWNLYLTHAEVEALNSGAGLAAGAIPPPADAVVLAIAGYVAMIDKIGGNNGVDITGVVGASGAIVTPHGLGAYNWLVLAADIAVKAGDTIADFVIRVAGAVESIGIQMCSSAVLTGWILDGPVGAVAGGLAAGLFGHHDGKPEDNQNGGVVADQPTKISRTLFVMMNLRPPDKVALLSWHGFFSAQQDGLLYANRPSAGLWETWTVMRHPEDGTVSFVSIHGHYMGTSSEKWHMCHADQPIPGPAVAPGHAGGWGRFFVEHVADGHIALRTASYNQYVNVVSGRTP